MSIGLIGRKVGMTQVFQDDGTMIPVSVVAIEPNTVTRLRTAERDGYTAIQLGIEPSQEAERSPRPASSRTCPRSPSSASSGSTTSTRTRSARRSR